MKGVPVSQLTERKDETFTPLIPMMGHNGGPTLDDFEDALSKDLAQFYDDPLGFVLYAYPWGKGELKGFDGPDEWQRDYLMEIGEAVKDRQFDGFSPVDPIRMATASGHGIGKSALTAWLVNWIMCTRPFCKGIVTANTSPQLETKTWAEIAKWTRRCVARHWFKVSTGKGNMKCVRIGYEDTWRCDAQTCREENSESFAGLHAANSTPFYIFDEASAVPNKIWEVAEGGLTDGEPMWFVFGNPTRNSGRFYDCFKSLKHMKRWIRKQIDSRTAKIPNKKDIEEKIETYGIDSDYIKVRVLGKFPKQSVKQFIDSDLVSAAMRRELLVKQYEFAPKIITCDPAWDGDDELVIAMRQGLQFWVLHTLPKNDNDVLIANKIAQLEDEHQADGVIIDFGYGTGIYSAGQAMGRDEWLLCKFGEKSPQAGYMYMRDYIWGMTKQWLKDGGSLPSDDEVLEADLIAPETVPRLDGVIQLESKKDMKKRDLPSPNRADALALSFAYPISKKEKYTRHVQSDNMSTHDYDPLNQNL